MSLAKHLVIAAVTTLPVPARERFREEWLADLAGAQELRLSPWNVVGGAVKTLITIDRTDPRLTGITRAHLAANRVCLAAAYLGIATLLGLGSWLWGGYGSLLGATGQRGIELLALLSAMLGLFACLGALVASFDADRRRTARVLTFGSTAILAAVITLSVMPLFWLLAVPVAVAITIVAASGRPGHPRTTPGSTLRRLAISVPFTVITLIIVSAGTLDIFVWNPQARLPGLSLDEIYASMAAAGETPLAGFVFVWAIAWAAAATTLPVLAGLTRRASFLTPRRIAVAGLLLVGTAASCHALAGFNMGMSLADTFATSLGDSASSGLVIAVAGQAALIFALLLGLVPRRHISDSGTLAT